MTTVPPSRPLLPVLARMAAGLLLAGGGALLAWQNVTLHPTPGMSVLDTPLSVPLDGPLPLDLAQSAALTFSGDLVDVTLRALPPGSALAVQGRVHHRARNPVQADVTRQGRALSAALTLRVQPLGQRGVIVTGPEPVQHTAALTLSRDVPFTLGSRTTYGDTTADLSALRVRSLTLRSDSGRQTLTLPARPAGPLSVVTRSGQVSVTAPPGSAPDALRVNTASGNQTLDLAAMRTQTLGVGTESGDVRLTLPTVTGRATLTTDSGNLTVTATPSTRGNLDIRTQRGDVTLRVPPALKVRVRFTDRDSLSWPRGAPAPLAPDLDVFVDAPRANFTLTPLEDTP
ncbi:DUF4097 family beta strand repeat-containing protein [Deinococcus knuensis]|uniref:DUF4097 domain-containing protein n=1 Tax=Deinococcus knuensis TaxID=1837380 RepID=A0ABQ2SCK8_9DEIO|nr:DUF4097 family beta strand repeat-containing protein [Deinococcus knuensis]GGS20175.1 hypothetical protein GCM10008961_09760 [Deinococcus knuensis]